MDFTQEMLEKIQSTTCRYFTWSKIFTTGVKSISRIKGNRETSFGIIFVISQSTDLSAGIDPRKPLGGKALFNGGGEYK